MRLTCIVGPMFAGKTSSLRKWIETETHVLVTKAALDTRALGLRSHDGWEDHAYPIFDIDQLAELYNKFYPEVLLIDDAQFLSVLDLDDLLFMCWESDVHIVAAGLDLDYQGKPWESMAYLLPRADEVVKLNARCAKCGREARMTQRLIDGKPAPLGPRVLIGGSESYEPRCRVCWQPPTAEYGPR